MACVEICHKGHALSPLQSGIIFCSCGTSHNCLITERPTLRVKSK